jgi:hypothetical protein
MNAKILAKFDNSGVTYVYYTLTNEPKKIQYGYVEDNFIKPLKTNKEVLMMQQAQKRIFISTDPENHVELGYTIYRKKLFKILYDKSSKLKFFYEVKDGKDYFPSEEDSRELFKIHNPINNYQEDSSEQNTGKKNKLKKKLVDILFVIEAVVFGASIGTTAGILFDKYVLPETPVTEIVSVEKYDSPSYYGEIGETVSKGEFSEERLLKTLKDNPNLSDAERKIFEAKIPILKKYQKYAHFTNIENKFATVKIEYILQPPPEDIGVSAYYNRNDNIIVIYYCTSIDDCSLSSFSHEAEHLITEPHESLGNGNYEASTENINFEQEYSESFSYTEECLIQRILLQIIPPEMVAADHFSGDPSYIIDELDKIIPSKELASQLLHAIDSVNSNRWTMIQNQNNENSDSKQLYDEASKMLIYNKELVKTILNKYFTAVKGYPMEEDFICLMYLKQLDMSFDDIYISFSSEDPNNSKLGNQPIKKGYFVDSYIEKYENASLDLNVLFPYTPEGYQGENPVKIPTIIRVSIDDSNRKLSSMGDGKGYTLKLSEINEVNLNNTFGIGISTGLENLISEEKNPGDSYERHAYLEQSTYVKMLCEIIGTKPFERYLETKNVDEIVNALYKIIPDKERAYTLIANIDITNIYYEDNLKAEGATIDEKPITETVGDVDEILIEARGQIFTELCRYFYEKRGYDLEEDILMNAYYSSLTSKFSFECYKFVWPIIFNLNTGENLGPDSYYGIIVNKAYFDEEYKESIPEPFIIVEGYDGGVKEESTYCLSRKIQVLENQRRMERIFGEGYDAFFMFDAKEITMDSKSY